MRKRTHPPSPPAEGPYWMISEQMLDSLVAYLGEQPAKETRLFLNYLESDDLFPIDVQADMPRPLTDEERLGVEDRQPVEPVTTGDAPLNGGASINHPAEVHASDCAVYNEPAERAGPCDCGGVPRA